VHASGLRLLSEGISTASGEPATLAGGCDVPSFQAHALKTYLRLQNVFRPRPERYDPLAERRELEDLARLFKLLGPVESVPVTLGSVPAEWLVPKQALASAILLYLHGGSYCAGSIASHRALAGNLARATGVRGLIIDYRLAPEHPFPAGIDDAAATYRALLATGFASDKIVVAGDSAGGGLSLALLLRLRDQGTAMPAAVACLSPWTDLSGSGTSHETRASKDVVLSSSHLAQAAQLYLAGADPRTPLASPLFADLQGLPPLLVQAGGDEILLDDATGLTERARACGVDVTLEVWPRMQHVWHFAASIMPEARRAIDAAGRFLRHALFGEATPST
jgi:monoterpene epsilon-lactone hydrolase